MCIAEAVGAHAQKRMSDADLLAMENGACPGAGACGGQFTANTMAMVCEFLGLSPMGSASVASTLDARKEEVAQAAGAKVMELLKDDLRPQQILTREAFENAIASVAATGGSTNAVLHLLAIAYEAGVGLSLDDFDRISERVPLLADLKPGGRFVATDLYRAGGTGLVAKRLDEAGLLHGSALTVSGKNIGDEAQSANETAAQEVVRPLGNPIKPTGGLVILKGNLAPEGCVVKIAGHEHLKHRGPARVFDSEEAAFAAKVQQGPNSKSGCAGDSLRRSARRTRHAQEICLA